MIGGVSVLSLAYGSEIVKGFMPVGIAVKPFSPANQTLSMKKWCAKILNYSLKSMGDFGGEVIYAYPLTAYFGKIDL